MENRETLLARPLVADGNLATLCRILAEERPEISLQNAQLLQGGLNHYIVDTGTEISRFLRADYLGMDAQNREAHTHESLWLQALNSRIGAIPLPQVTHIGQSHAFFCYRKIAGISLTETAIAEMTRSQRHELGQQVAAFLVQLHTSLAAEEAAALHVPTQLWFLSPEQLLQQSWPHLPTELKPLAEEAAAVYSSLGNDDSTLLHGDMFPANMLVQPRMPHKLSGIIDFTNMLWQQRVVDFRKLHRLGADGFEACLQAYETATGKSISAHQARMLGAVDYLSYIGMFANQRDCSRQLNLLAGVALNHG